MHILIGNLVQSAQDLRVGQRFPFIKQGNDPKHTAKTTPEWLRVNSVNVLEWSSQIPFRYVKSCNRKMAFNRGSVRGLNSATRHGHMELTYSKRLHWSLLKQK